MKKIIVYIVVALLVVSTGILGFLYVSNRQSATEQNEQRSEPLPIGEEQPSDAVSTRPVAYVDYTDTILDELPGTTKILFFHAPWCPQCRQLDADIKKGPIPDNVTFIKTDYDSNQDLRQKYGVTLQTTLVRVDDEGNAVDKYVAYNDPTLANVIAAMLPQ